MMSDSVIGKVCRLTRSLRDASSKIRKANEEGTILREVDNLGRKMLLVKFSDNTSTFLFPNEIEIITNEPSNEHTGSDPQVSKS